MLSGGGEGLIKIWRIDEDDCNLIHTLRGHTDLVTKVIELGDGRMCSCSNDTTIRITTLTNALQL